MMSFTGAESFSDLKHGSAKIHWTDSESAFSYDIIDFNTGISYGNVAAPASEFELTNLSPNTSYDIVVRANWADYRIPEDANEDVVSFTTTLGLAPVFSGSQVSARKDGSVAATSPNKGEEYRGGIYIGDTSVSGEDYRFIPAAVDQGDTPWVNNPNPSETCSQLVVDGKEDFYLPNINELQKIYNEKEYLSGLSLLGTEYDTFYWSSSVNGSGDRLGISFVNGSVKSVDGSLFSPSSGNIRCVRKVLSSTTGEVENILRAEYFNSGFYEIETPSTTNSYSFSYQQQATGEQGVVSCQDFDGYVREYEITIFLSGLGSVSSDILELEGDCDGSTLSCFMSGTNPEAEQRLMEKSGGGCQPIKEDFENLGVVNYTIAESLKEVYSYPSSSDFFDLFQIRRDGKLDIVNNGSLASLPFIALDIEGSEIPPGEDLYTETSTPLKSCLSQRIDFKKYNMFLDDGTSLILNKMDGVCDGSDLSCGLLEIPNSDGTSPDEIKLMESSPNGCQPILSGFQEDGEIFADYLINAPEVKKDGVGVGADRIQIRRNSDIPETDGEAEPVGSETYFINYINSNTPDEKEFTYTKESSLEGDLSILGCSFNGSVTSFEILDSSSKLVSFKQAHGECGQIAEVNCLVADSDGGKSFYEISRGGCIATEESFDELGSAFVEKELAIESISELNTKKFDLITNHGYEREMISGASESGSYTITNTETFPSTGFELKSCYSFIGERRELDIQLDPDLLVEYSIGITEYAGDCDGEPLSCYILDDGPNPPELMSSFANEETCEEVFLGDFLEDGIEGIAGDSLPDQGSDLVDGENFVISAQSLTTGLNEITKEPLDGSNWTVEYSEPFAGNCNPFPQHMHNDGDLIETVNDYLPTSESNCSIADHPEDTLNQIEWDNLGIVRKAQFGTETIFCGRDNSCDIDLQVTNGQDIFSSITPEKGEDGTSPARGRVFLYDFNSVSSSNDRGIGGAGGLANLASTPVTEKYCVDLKDYNTEGGGSDFAANPSLGVQVIDWIPFSEGQDAAQGLTPDAEDERSYIYKGLSDGILHYIKRDNIYLGEEWDE